MARPKLEVFDFSNMPSDADVETTNLAALEEAKLAAYDLGYQAGWADAAAAQSDETALANQALMLNLQSLSFTWAEAHSHMLENMTPLFGAILNQLLPKIAKATLAPILLEHLLTLTKNQINQPIHLVIHPQSRQKVEHLLTNMAGLPLEITEDPSVSESHAHLRFVGQELSLDFDRVINEIAALTDSFFSLELESKKNG